MKSAVDYLSIREAAELLGVSPATLRNWDSSGKLVALRDPRSNYRLYTVEDISRLLDELGSADAPTTSVASSLTPSPPSRQQLDARALRLLVRQMSRAFRDSMGGGLLERFEEISKLLYCKLYDERQTQSLVGYVARFVRKPNESAQSTHERLCALYQEAISKLPHAIGDNHRELSSDIHAVVNIVETLQGIDLSEVPADVKGTVYEELVRNTFDKTDNQQFFTPRPVVSFMVQFADVRPGQIVCDPACGSGGFLIEVANHLRRVSSETRDETGASVTMGTPQHEGHLFGLEIDRRMAWVAQMNLMMNGEGEGRVYYLPGGGALARSQKVDSLFPQNSLDVILTNPPFGSDFADIDHLRSYELGKGKQSRRRGVLFIERCIEWLKPGGCLGIVIDESVLNGDSNEDVRRYILARCVVEAVISLPDVTFMPYSSAKSSILFLKKKLSRHDQAQSPVFMATVENVGRKPNGDPLYSTERDKSGRPLLLNDLALVVKAWTEYKKKGGESIAHLSPNVFTCGSERFWNGSNMLGETRLDVQFHHPSRKVAEATLARAVYPTPALAELVVLRNDTVVPNAQDPDDIWRYVGLANISPGTGEYTVSEVIGSQVRSAVRLFRPGDILFSKLRPELRKCALVSDDEDEGYVSAECLVLCPISSALKDPHLQPMIRNRLFTQNWEVDGEYLAILLRSDIAFGQLVYQITGLGRPRVSMSSVLGVRIPLPDLQVQRTIVATYKMAWQRHLRLRRQSETALREADAELQEAYAFVSERLFPNSN